MFDRATPTATGTQATHGVFRSMNRNRGTLQAIQKQDTRARAGSQQQRQRRPATSTTIRQPQAVTEECGDAESMEHGRPACHGAPEHTTRIGRLSPEPHYNGSTRARALTQIRGPVPIWPNFQSPCAQHGRATTTPPPLLTPPPHVQTMPPVMHKVSAPQ